VSLATGMPPCGPNIAPCIVYEYDFDRRGNKTYQPSFFID
jgi:hypothetical protein